MRLYKQSEQYKLYHGNMLDMLEVIEPNSIDSVVCDPPYELNFMGKGWDNSGIAFNKEAWAKCYEVLKPGGYLLAFGGTRTYHRIACAIEDAGFEIRDCIMYLYGSGFPKSLNIGLAVDKKNGVESEVIGISGNSAPDLRDVGKKSKEAIGIDKLSFGQIENADRTYTEIKKAKNEWNGWGTALKPAYEPIIVARKPFKSSVAENIMQYGVGGINIDECRVGSEERTTPIHSNDIKNDNTLFGLHPTIQHERIETNLGRFPANVIHDGSEEAIKDMPIANRPNGSITKEYEMNNQVYGDYGHCNTWVAYQDSGSASRYFYTAKASRKDRDEGLDMFESKQKIFNGKSNQSSTDIKDVEERFTTIGKNIHPTVKPIELMQYLVRLVTPKNGTILDCFMGSGSTGKATMFENRERSANYKFIGIELTEEYLPICEARIEYAINKYEYDFKKELEEAKKEGQLNIFEIGDE